MAFDRLWTWPQRKLKNNIGPQQRAETLNIEDWLKLIKSFKIE